MTGQAALVAALGLTIGIALAIDRSRRKPLGAFDMLAVIAREAKSESEFARRAEAWNASEAKPLSVRQLVAAYARAHRLADRRRLAHLLQQAEGARAEAKERLWSRVAKGLR